MAPYLQYGMDILLDSINEQLAVQLGNSFPLSASSPNYVFKWLELADTMQLDELKASCREALGCSLRYPYCKHFKAHKPVLSRLSHATVVEVMEAVICHKQ